MTNTKISIDRKRREDRVVLLWGVCVVISVVHPCLSCGCATSRALRCVSFSAAGNWMMVVRFCMSS